MSNITQQTIGLIVVGDKLYKLSPRDLKTLNDILTASQGYYFRGNKAVLFDNTDEFIEVIEKKYKPVGFIHGIYN